MGKVDNERLHRYFDGELSTAERARVEAELSDEDRERLAAMAEMRALVTGALEAEAEGIDLWPGVEAALAVGRKEADELPYAGGVRVSREATKRRTQSRWRDLRSRVAAGGLMAAAVAALLLIAHPWDRGTHALNNCDVEELEVEGAVATVLDFDEGEDGLTTIIWTDEDETEEN